MKLKEVQKQYPDAMKAVLTIKREVNECTYRMLKAHEIQAAMAFDSDYIIIGDSKQKVKQLGNAVTPPAMELLIDRVLQPMLFTSRYN